jgi:2-polyprenyl-3-methyl-5-hydroxy-6-metoxy-1,4-benzoquinol methylase
MITEDEFLKSELGWGIGFHNPDFVNLADVTAHQVKDYPIKSVMDYGAGTGVYASAFHRAGYDTSAYEIWAAHTNYIKENAPYLNIIDKPITTDLMLLIEVSEHMTDKELNKLFKDIKPTYILHSSTSEVTDWDGDWGHINIKTQQKWIDFFDGKGYEMIKNLSYPTPYAKLFKLK